MSDKPKAFAFLEKDWKETMKIGIIAAMPEELKILLEHLENPQKHLRLGHVYHTGSIGRHEVVLVESGIGKVMSAMSVAVLVNDFKVTAVINTGSAGAVAEGLAISVDRKSVV